MAGWIATLCLGTWGFAIFGLKLMSGWSAALDVAWVPLFWLVVACLVLGILISWILILRKAWAAKVHPILLVLIGAVTAALGVIVFVFGAVAAWAASGVGRGRQLRRLGRVLLPKVGPAADWSQIAVGTDVAAEVRSKVAGQWRENGRTEHASVAAFAQLSLELLSLGAPPPLVRAAGRDGQDEIRHAELCFSLARAIDGAAGGPEPFPQVLKTRRFLTGRSLALVRLAINSLIDGALHEGLSARVIAQLSKRCREPANTAVLKELAADEGRHAAHAWDVVAWCLREGGWPVARGLQGAVSALGVRSRHRSDRPQPARGGAWECYGIPGSALEADEEAKAREEIAHRVAQLIEGKPVVAA